MISAIIPTCDRPRQFLDDYDFWNTTLVIQVIKAGGVVAAAPKAIANMGIQDGRRLRRYPIDRLSFLWKYQSMIDLPDMLTRSLSELLKTLRVRLRCKFGGKQR